MASSKNAILALDIGGSKIEGIVWDGRIISGAKAGTPRNRKAFLNTVEKITRRLKGKRGVMGIGVSIAGAIDQKNGMIVNSPNLKFTEGLDMAKILKKKFRVPVRVKNDAKCFLLGELRFGTARGKKNVIGMIIGTGLGGAIYLDGKLQTGAHGFAGEQGMMKILVGRKSFSAEDLISSHGFKRLGAAKPLDCQNRAFAGDKKAVAIYNEIGKYLGIHFSNLVELFDPELIIVGGGISRAGRLLLKPALAEMKKHAGFPKKYWPEIKISKLENAGVLGAVALFR